MSPHEEGYRAFQLAGLAARCPYFQLTDPDALAAEEWKRGFDKAAAEAGQPNTERKGGE